MQAEELRSFRHIAYRLIYRSKGAEEMILSQKQIEEIAAAVTRDFNEFFFGCETDKARIARATPIDQFATDYLSLDTVFLRSAAVRYGSDFYACYYGDTVKLAPGASCKEQRHKKY